VPASSRPKILGLIFSLAAITYMDRLLISAAAPAISREFGLSTSRMGYIFSAFALGYALFEIPAGWWGDKIGARRALTRIVLCWSAFTALTGATVGFASLLIIRFVFGAGEAGAFPNIARTVANWFPSREQGRAMSASFLGIAMGSSLTAPIVLWLLARQSWRTVFCEFGVIGLLWIAAWLLLYQDHAVKVETSPEKIDWRWLSRSANLWCICGMYFAYGYGLYFYVTWLPTYLLKGRGFSADYAGFFSALPWVASAGGYLAGGWITDRLAASQPGRAGNLRAARCGVGIFGYAVSAAILVAVALTPDRMIAAALLACAAFFQMMVASPAWAVCLDVGHRRAGLVTGCMNTAGNIGGALAPLLMGYMVQYLGSWDYPFFLTVLVFGFGILMWSKVNPEQPLV